MVTKGDAIGIGTMIGVGIFLAWLAVSASGCGDVGSSHVDVAQNQNSQNGETNCTSTCEPAQNGDAIGFLVTTTCKGNSFSGPEFVSQAPSGCTLSDSTSGASAGAPA